MPPIRWKCFLFCTMAWAGMLPAQTQAPNEQNPQLIPRTGEQREQQYNATHRIQLNVQVTDAAGNAVTGLRAQDFSLLVNRQPQKITLFRDVDDGAADNAHVVLVLDELNNSGHDLSYAKKEIGKLLSSWKDQLPLPTSVAVLDTTGFQLSAATRDGAALAAEVEKAVKGVHPTTCTKDWNTAALGVNSAIMSPVDTTALHQQAAEGGMSNCLNGKLDTSLSALRDFAHRQQDVQGRALVVWIGPGWPVIAGPGFDTVSAHARESYFDNLVGVTKELREGQVTLDAVSWPVSSPVERVDPAHFDELLRGTPTPEKASAESVAMPIVAHLSGGQVYLNQKSLAADLAACLKDGQAYYVLAFDSAHSAAPDEFRQIEVTVDRPGARARTLTGYYAQP